MLKAIEENLSCEKCDATQREAGDPDARCETHTKHIAPKYRKTTLGEQGSQLPIALDSSDRTFALKEFNYGEERKIDDMRSKKGGAGNHPGRTVTTVLAHMLTKWKGEDLSQTEHKKIEAKLRDSSMEDVLFAWVFFRTMEIDPVIELDITCIRPSCAKKYDWRGDLRGLEIEVADEQIEPIPFKLSGPLTWLREEYDTLMLMPPKWSVMNLVKEGGNMADIKAKLAMSAVHSLRNSAHPEQAPISVSERALDFVHKRDVDRLVRAVNDLFPSMDSSFELECPHCKHKHETSLDWTWDFFFGASSMPKQPTA